PTIPLDSWIYPALDKLAGLGLVDSALQGSRPFSRLEAARLTREARDRADTSLPPPVALETLRRLERELADALADLAGNAGSTFRPLREARLDYLYQEGAPATTRGTNARQFALNANNFGIDYDDGHNGQLTLAGDARLGSALLVSLRPLALLGDDGEADLRLLEGKVAVGLGPVEISVGRQALWWGQGRNGALVLTNNAKPLDMLRITNPTPATLPWLFKYLGPIRFDLFWSELESDRDDVDEPYFAGLRLNLKPARWLELGASRTVMFGGDGIDVDWSDFVTILGGKNLEGGDDTSNSVAAVDARLRLPFLWGAELYGELGGEDEAGAWISRKAWLGGLYLPRLEPSGRLSLRLERADLTTMNDDGDVWYRHGLYTSGYTYGKKILGHQVGGGARSLFGELELRLPGDVNLTLGADYQERGLSLPVQEKHFQPFAALEWALHERLTLAAGYHFDRVRNAGYVDGAEREDHLVRVGAVGKF
ncbi:MAG: capsule assembly Wzi family protein, partial [Desulfuromonadales bacterium]|nr:capsule assembly Wzi family protein [Desulfuromonadales bacterium]